MAPEPPPEPGDPGFTGPVSPPRIDLRQLVEAIPDRHTSAIGADPGTLDLSLPTLEELLAAATINPKVERDRVESGNPAMISDLAADLATAGGDMTRAAEYSALTQQQLAASLTANGGPAYDPAAHNATVPAGLPDAGPRLAQLSDRLAAVSTDLATTQADAVTTWNTMLTALEAKHDLLQSRIAEVTNAQGLVPFPEVPGLLATRDTIAASMQVDVNAAGQTMDTRRRTYQDTFTPVLDVLADAGIIPPSAVTADPGGPSPEDGPAEDEGGGLGEFVGDVVSGAGQVIGDTAGTVWDLLPVRAIWEPNDYTDDLVRYAGGAADSVGALVADPGGTLLQAGKDAIGYQHWVNGEPGRAVGQIAGEVLLGGAVGKALSGLRRGAPGPVPAAVRPTVEDPKLRNFVDAVYRGVDNPHRVGDGTTADAVRHERSTGTEVHGRNHETKARETVRGLNNWLRKNPDASASDRGTAEAMRDDLQQALGG
jgi:hypothetical protein